MKAVVIERFGSADELHLVNVSEPVPGPGEAVIAVRGCGVCYQDVMNRAGKIPRTALPAILGHEIAGEVVAIGADVRDLAIGDRVICTPRIGCGTCVYCQTGRETICRSSVILGGERPGGYAEAIAIPARALVKLPASIPLETAGIIACTLGTAFHALRSRAGVGAGDTVLITGASGGVGIHAIQVARALGARVIAVTSSPEKADALARAGADEVIARSDLGFHAEARRLTADAGVDCVIDTIGGPAFEPSVRSLRAGGTIVLIGNILASPVQVNPGLVILKELAIVGSAVVTKAELQKVVDLVARGLVKPIVSKVLPLAEAATAHRMLESRQARGRIVLVP